MTPTLTSDSRLCSVGGRVSGFQGTRHRIDRCLTRFRKRLRSPAGSPNSSLDFTGARCVRREPDNAWSKRCGYPASLEAGSDALCLLDDHCRFPSEVVRARHHHGFRQPRLMHVAPPQYTFDTIEQDRGNASIVRRRRSQRIALPFFVRREHQTVICVMNPDISDRNAKIRVRPAAGPDSGFELVTFQYPPRRRYQYKPGIQPVKKPGFELLLVSRALPGEPVDEKPMQLIDLAGHVGMQCRFFQDHHLRVCQCRQSCSSVTDSILSLLGLNYSSLPA